MPESAPARRAFLKTASAALVASVVRSAPVVGQGHEAQGPQQDPALTAWPEAPGADALLPAPEAVFRPTSSGCTVQWVPACALVADSHIVTAFEERLGPQNLSRAREHLQQAKRRSAAPGERRAEKRKVKAEKGELNHETPIGTSHERRRP